MRAKLNIAECLCGERFARAWGIHVLKWQLALLGSGRDSHFDRCLRHRRRMSISVASPKSWNIEKSNGVAVCLLGNWVEERAISDEGNNGKNSSKVSG